ncbi:MAG: histidinol-phosphate transaminase [Candidatus Omnitrophica bacterium]|nr:histidinol-phosphate transaminase [Candidatus Omnitrophota bacterium]
MKEITRKNILNIKPYVAGRPIEEIKRQLRLKKVIKLASNENPLGSSAKARIAIIKGLKSINRYPDSDGFYLKRKLAGRLWVKPENIILGNGSDELIEIIIKTFVEEDENVVTADVTFLEYEIIAKTIGRKVKKIPLKYFKYDLEAIRRNIDKKTKVIFIANPNNPTGTYVTKYELEDFIKDLPADLVLVLDEAYDAFIDVNDFPNSLKYIKNKNVIILKTFSKSYGLAGLRVGYAIANQEIISSMEKARQPFNVNSLAQIGAIAALDDKKFLQRSRKLILQGKRYLYAAFRKLGLIYLPSVSNFILIDVGREGVSVFNDMLKSGVIVRDMEQYGLKNYIRVTVGKRKENERFIKVLKKVL